MKRGFLILVTCLVSAAVAHACDFCRFTQIGIPEQEMVWQSDAILLVDVSVLDNTAHFTLRKILKGNEGIADVGSEVAVVGQDGQPVTFCQVMVENTLQPLQNQLILLARRQEDGPFRLEHGRFSILPNKFQIKSKEFQTLPKEIQEQMAAFFQTPEEIHAMLQEKIALISDLQRYVDEETKGVASLCDVLRQDLLQPRRGHAALCHLLKPDSALRRPENAGSRILLAYYAMEQADKAAKPLPMEEEELLKQALFALPLALRLKHDARTVGRLFDANSPKAGPFLLAFVNHCPVTREKWQATLDKVLKGPMPQQMGGGPRPFPIDVPTCQQIFSDAKEELRKDWERYANGRVRIEKPLTELEDAEEQAIAKRLLQAIAEPL